MSGASQMPLAPVTVVLGVMIDSPTCERALNLTAALTSLSLQTLDRSRYRIVLIEQGPEPHLEALVRPAVDEYVFAYGPGRFNRSWALNIGAMRAATGIVCTFDADLIVPRDFLQRGLMAWQCGALAIKPFDQILYMDAESTERVRQQLTQGQRVYCDHPSYRGHVHPWSKGGCIWIDAGLYRALGGHDERFEGWGDEDRDFWVRLTRRTKVVTFPRRVLHLYHARDFERHPEVAANRLLLRALKAGFLPPQRGVIGDVHRYARDEQLRRAGADRPLHPMLTNGRSAAFRKDSSENMESLRCRDVPTASVDPAYLWRRGSAALTRGELDVAIVCLTRAVTLDRRSAGCLIALGHALLRAGRHSDALRTYLIALTIAPEDAVIYRATGRALQMRGLLREAAAVYREAIFHDPADAATFSTLGDTLRRQTQLAEAREACEIAVKLDSRAPYTHWQLGSVFASQREWDAALSTFRHALHLLENPRRDDEQEHALVAVDSLDAYALDMDRLDAYAPEELKTELNTRIGDALLHLGRTKEAVEAFRDALTLIPTHVRACRQLALALEFGGETRDAANAWVALGAALQARDRFGEARAAYRQALKYKPDCLRATINLGRVHLSLGSAHDAVHWFERALAIDPEHTSAHTDLGKACHLTGESDRGWDEFAWFWSPQALKRRSFEQPLWDGATLGNKTMLVWAEQALGDTIQWLRYLPHIKRLNPSARLIVECQRNLVPLARHLDGVDRVMGEGSPPPHVDVHVPLSLVPTVCRSLRRETSRVPYLSVNQTLVDVWRQRLARADHARTSSASTRLVVGLSWAGHPEGLAARQRFTTLAAFAPLASLTGARFVSLQIGRQAAQVLGPLHGLKVEQLQDGSHSTQDTAALMQSLDLIITVDTMIAHLAGALGRPVWVVLPHVADWRWSRDTDRSPLYPTMTLFRQTRRGDWQGVFSRVRAALERVRDGMQSLLPDAVTHAEVSNTP
jgi:tetratricopeptide (TPR) repeat protein